MCCHISASAGCPVSVARRSARLGTLLHQPVASLDNRSHEIIGRVLPSGRKGSCPGTNMQCSDFKSQSSDDVPGKLFTEVSIMGDGCPLCPGPDVSFQESLEQTVLLPGCWI